MSRLDEASYLQLFDAIRRVRDVSDPDDFGAVVLGEIDRLVASDVSSFNEVDPAASRVAFVVHPASFPIPRGSVDVLTRLAAEHPLIAYVRRTGDGSARRISDEWSTDQWHASALYRELYASMGIEHQVSIALPAPLPIVVGIALNRCGSDFSDRDLAVLDLLRPHLAQSWRQAREHRYVRTLLRSATEALVAASVGAVVLSDPLHELTAGALVELYRRFGRPGPSGPLPPRVSRWVAAQGRAADGLTRPLSTTRDGARAILRLVPATQGHPATLLLSVEDVAATVPVLGAAGLSAREIEVLRAVATGATNAEIGASLQISGSTVKKHLDRIYHKLGVSGRVAATAVMWDMTAHHSR